MQRGQVVLVDTNIIIECVRVECWAALTAHFRVETVGKCCEEARTGNARRAGYVKVDDKALRAKLIVNAVGNGELVALNLSDPYIYGLDDGERHLWAHAFGRSDAWMACCCDRAAINAAMRLGWADRLVSLEQLISAVGSKSALKSLKEQFGSARLSAWRTEALLKRKLK